MGTSQLRQILAASISPFDKTKKVPPNILLASFTSVFLKAWGVSNIMTTSKSRKSFDGFLFVEGQMWSLEIGGVHIFSMPIEMIDEVTEAFLKTSETDSVGEEFGGNLMILALGSPVFCQDIIRFAGVNRKGQIETPVDEFTSRVALAKPGEVIWSDSETENSLHEGNMIAMFLEAKRMGAIPD